MANITYPNNQSTLTLDGYTFQHLAQGASIVLAPVNDATSRVNSTNGGVSVAKRVDGDVHTLTIQVQKHSPDDIFCNDILNGELTDVTRGSMKRVYHREGESFKETYQLEGGSITTRPTETQNNQELDVVMEYVFTFRSAVRSL